MAAPADADHLWLRSASGRVPLGFAEDGARVYLVARERSAAWPIALLRDGWAELVLSDGPRAGSARLVTGADERDRILALFRAKYGEEQYRRWYEHPARVLAVDAGRGERPGGPGSEAYYAWLTAEFDNVAEEYDRHITGNRMNRLLRDRSLAHLTTRFAGDRHLFEVGCGSGMETLPLLRAGHEILAVDISERMLEVVRSKARAEGRTEQLRTERLRARDLGRLVVDQGPGSFDGGYSTYGALNCEPDLAPVPVAVAALLRPGAAFVAGVYNRWCAFELVGYTLALQPRRAWGRRRNPVPVGASRFCVDTYAHSVGEFRRLFAGFTLERLEGVPVLLPPSDLASYAERFSRQFETLARWDRWWGRRGPIARWGDHFLMTLVRT